MKPLRVSIPEAASSGGTITFKILVNTANHDSVSVCNAWNEEHTNDLTGGSPFSDIANKAVASRLNLFLTRVPLLYSPVLSIDMIDLSNLSNIPSSPMAASKTTRHFCRLRDPTLARTSERKIIGRRGPGRAEAGAD